MAEKKVRYKSGKGSAVGSLVQIQTTLAPSAVVGYILCVSRAVYSLGAQFLAIWHCQEGLLLRDSFLLLLLQIKDQLC
jgi:hypothetical protein